MHGLDNSTTGQHGAAWALLFAWGYSSLFINPFYLLLMGLLGGGASWLSIMEISWLALLRGLANGYLRRSPLEIATTPLAAWGVLVLGLATIRRRWQGQKTNWKGRYYMG
jgi:hypothetical protein